MAPKGNGWEEFNDLTLRMFQMRKEQEGKKGTLKHPDKKQGKVECPYLWCGDVLMLLPNIIDPQTTDDKVPDSLKATIPSHPVKHEALTGACPASLMYYPVSDYVRQILDEMALQDEKRMMRWLDYRMYREASGAAPPTESQSLRGPHRMSREPPPRSKDWGLKGRADEDIQPDAVWHQPPAGVHGEGVGQVSVQETLEALNGAAIKLNEVQGIVGQGADNRSNLAQGREMVIEARDMVMGAKGNVEAETLNNYIGMTITAEEKLREAIQCFDDASQAIAAALEFGETYAGVAQS